MNIPDYEKLVAYRKELLETERWATQDIEGYELTPTGHLFWLTYHAEVWNLRVIIVLSINQSFDGFALIDKDNDWGQDISMEMMKGTVPELIQYLVDRFNESQPLAV